MKYKLTDQQINIINELKTGNNLKIQAGAGSGKTSTMFELAKAYPNKKFVVLTYNKALQISSNERKEQESINNIEFFTFHGFHNKVKKVYVIKDDISFENHLRMPITNNLNEEVLVIDECQDIRVIYFNLIKQYIKERNPQLIFLGDNNQAVYDGLHANKDIFKYIEKYLNPYSNKWSILPLNVTFRNTDTMVNLVNHLMGYETLGYIKRSEHKPRLILQHWAEGLKGEVQYYLDLGYKPYEIFVLSPSTKTGNSRRPLAILEKYLTNKDIRIFNAKDNDIKISDNDLKYSLIMGNFHNIKGLERKVVIVDSFDEGYFKYFNTNSPSYQMNEPLYVAVTRASERLSLISRIKEERFSFFKDEKYVDFIMYAANQTPYEVNNRNINKWMEHPGVDVRNNKKMIKKGIRDIIKFLPLDIEQDIVKNIKIIKTIQIEDSIKINKGKEHIKLDNHIISTAAINGILINEIIYNIYNKEEINTEILKKVLNWYKDKALAVNDSHFIKKYITKHNKLWINDETLRKIQHNVKCFLKNNLVNTLDLIFEYEKLKKYILQDINEGSVAVKGIPDIFIENNKVIEIKYVNEITWEHRIQAVLYGFLAELPTYLVNIRTGIIEELEYSGKFNDLMTKMCRLQLNRSKNKTTTTELMYKIDTDLKPKKDVDLLDSLLNIKF